MKKFIYTLTIVLIASCTICNVIQAKTPITYGQTIQSTISTPGEVDTLTLTGSTNDIITAALYGDWGANAQLEIYNPSGALLKRASGNYYTYFDSLFLPSTGLYTILIMDSDGNEAGIYGLSLQRRFNPGLATPIVYGQTKDSSITKYAQMNTYTFTGSINDIITAALYGDWGANAQLEIYSPSGALLKRVIRNYYTYIDSLLLPSNGLYTIIIMDSDANEAGNYGLSIQRRFNPGQATPISYGQTKDSTISKFAQMNTYTFTGSINDVVTINLSVSWGNSAQLELYNPTGALLRRVSANNISNINSLSLPIYGLYTILVMDGNADQTGSYTLALNGIQSLPVSLDLKVLIEGLYAQGLNQLARKDTMKVYLRNVTPPYSIVDSAKGTIDSLSLSGHFSFYNVTSGTYYIVVKHFNSIETWSKSGGEPLIRDTSTNIYDFTTSNTKAYGNNQKLVDEFPVQFAIYCGDINQDGFIDLTDVLIIFTDANAFASGKPVTDLNGDNQTDLTDVLIAHNNSAVFVSLMRP